MEIRELESIVGGRCYRTRGAMLIARECWPEEKEHEDGALATTLLYRTGKGNYFRQIQSHSPLMRDQIEPVNLDEARLEYLQMPLRVVELAVAFPGSEIDEA